jgi:hypothetical protein
MTTTLPDVDELAHLEFDATVPCNWRDPANLELHCPTPAEWQITIRLTGHPRTMLQFGCDAHKMGFVAHLPKCSSCADLFEVVEAVRIR